jgi:hypothetical protein
MTFYEEPTHYEKTIISDLQGSWQNFRDTVVQNHPFPESERLLFHIDEAMSWESVRDLRRMRNTLLLIQNLCTVNSVPEELIDWVEEIVHTLQEVMEREKI